MAGMHLRRQMAVPPVKDPLSLKVSGLQKTVIESSDKIIDVSSTTTAEGFEASEIVIEESDVFKDKKHYCNYCNERKTHTDRLWSIAHKEETEVLEIQASNKQLRVCIAKDFQSLCSCSQGIGCI
jgi:thymidine kinase